ncbi:MAG: bifunctional phosphopantothenoylcysteine decarboxylase/phosphopantothenate--cysteine ligase CoaBC [Thermodesulfobacteriota bacterium]
MPSPQLAHRHVLLGVTGSIAAYKAPDFVRRLREGGAAVSVVLTESASRFVSPLTFQALSGSRVYTGMFEAGDGEMPHIGLARGCDLVLVAPATAQTVSSLAGGAADSLLAAIILACRAPVVVCPAMNSHMYQHPATQANLERLRHFGYRIVEPECGAMACGEEGPGRLPEWDAIREALLAALAPQDLAGETVLVTAGPTREFLDPVRYLSNRSSGRMGDAVCRTARRRGARVILVSGPTALPPPPGVELVRVTTALEMAQAVERQLAQASLVVKTAAVADFRPAVCAATKIKKAQGVPALDLVANPDILAEVGRRRGAGPSPFLVGFAAESLVTADEGWRKLREKNLDLLVANDISRADAGFDVDAIAMTLFLRDGSMEECPLLTKEEAADRLWDQVVLRRPTPAMPAHT